MNVCMPMLLFAASEKAQYVFREEWKREESNSVTHNIQRGPQISTWKVLHSGLAFHCIYSRGCIFL